MIRKLLLITKLEVILICILCCIVVIHIDIPQSEEVTMEDFGTFNNVSQYLPPAAPLRVNINRGWEYVRIINNSPYLLTVDFGSSLKLTLPEMYLEDIKIPGQSSGWIVLTPNTNLTNTTQSISSSISVTTFLQGEIKSPQAQPLTQQAVNVTASGKPIFTASIAFYPTVNTVQKLNIFNPANSGVTATFHSARCGTNDTTLPLAKLLYFSGADNNLGTAVAAASHAGSSAPPVSVMHCTASDDNVNPSPTSTIEIIQGNSTTPDVLAFPDNVTLQPGGNLMMALFSSGGKTNYLSIKWTENTIVLPTAIGGPGAVASSIVNDNSPAGTNIIEARPVGDGTSAVLLNNTGNMTLGDASNAGSLAVNVINDLNARGIISVTDTGPGTQNTRLQADTQVRIQVPQGTDIMTFSAGVATLAAGNKLALLAGSLTRFTGFSGTGNGTVNTNLGATPNQIFFNPCSVSGSVQTIGGTVAQSSVVTTGSALAWGAGAFKDI